MAKISNWMPSPVVVDRPIFAIGDIHGSFDLFSDLSNEIRNILQNYQGPADLIYLGDYIDRGFESDKVLNMVAAGLNIPELTEHALIGNHEQFMMLATHGPIEAFPYILETWMKNGGVTTLLNLGLDYFILTELSHEEVRDEIIGALGPDRMSFLSKLKTHVRIGRLLFVHAGIHPTQPIADTMAIPLDHLDGAHWCWIRDEFLNWNNPYPEDVFVVHGHTPVTEVDFRENRLNIDTGAFVRGVLTAVEFRGDRLRLIQAVQ